MLPQMKYLCLLLPALLLCSLPAAADDDDFLYKKITFHQAEVPFYTFPEYTSLAALQVGYAQSAIVDPNAWHSVSKGNVAYEIDLVFTLYPRKIDAWRTNYYDLLEERLRALQAIDSSLIGPHIRWNMILQTQCESEEDAKSLFHGFVIKYKPLRTRMIDDVQTPDQLREIISGNLVTRDSTVLKVLDRHPEWENMLMVMDWTGSMYKFGAQVALWHKYNAIAGQSRVKYFVFFNDGNNKQTYQKKPGRTGGVYQSKSADLAEIVETMEYVMKKGNGGDSPENNIEALLTGIQYLSDFQDIVMIADNKSDVRDLELLDKIDRPVHIILCDLRGEPHPHYVEIARRTGGSLHTVRKDVSYERVAGE
jgi:hypothetical protein